MPEKTMGDETFLQPIDPIDPELDRPMRGEEIEKSVQNKLDDIKKEARFFWRELAEEMKKARKYLETGDLYKKLGEDEKSKEMWEKEIERVDKSLTQAENEMKKQDEQDNFKKINESLIISELLERGAETFERLGEKDKAEKLRKEKDKKMNKSGMSGLLKNSEKDSGMLETRLQRLESIKEERRDYYKIAIIQEKLGNEKEAKQAWQKVIDKYKDSENFEKLSIIATAFEKLDDFQNAQEVWEKMARQAEQKKLYAVAAGIYEKSNYVDRAIEMWEEELKELSVDHNNNRKMRAYDGFIKLLEKEVEKK